MAEGGDSDPGRRSHRGDAYSAWREDALTMEGLPLPERIVVASVVAAEIDPICALQACMEGLHGGLPERIVVARVVDQIDIFVTTAGNEEENIKFALASADAYEAKKADEKRM